MPAPILLTRERPVSAPVSSREDLANLAIGLLQAEMPLPKSVRLLGVSISLLQNETSTEQQLLLPT